MLITYNYPTNKKQHRKIIDPWWFKSLYKCNAEIDNDNKGTRQTKTIDFDFLDFVDFCAFDLNLVESNFFHHFFVRVFSHFFIL